MRRIFVAAMLLSSAALPACTPAESATEETTPAATAEISTPAKDPILDFTITDIDLSMTLSEARNVIKRAGFVVVDDRMPEDGVEERDVEGSKVSAWKADGESRIVGLHSFDDNKLWKIDFMQKLPGNGDAETILSAIIGKYGEPKLQNKASDRVVAYYATPETTGPQLRATTGKGGLKLELSHRDALDAFKLAEQEKSAVIVRTKRQEDAAKLDLKF